MATYETALGWNPVDPWYAGAETSHIRYAGSTAAHTQVRRMIRLSCTSKDCMYIVFN